MKILKETNIEPYARLIWVSERAKKTWSEAIAQLNSFMQQMEVESVIHGHRRVSWQTIREDEFLRYAKGWAERGLYIFPVTRVRTFQGFAHKHDEPVPGEVASICVVLSKRREDALEYRRAYERGDNDTQGYLLGFPACCRRFFEKVWAQSYYDPIWQAALNSRAKKQIDERKMRIKAHPYSLATLRYVGLRISFHIPCAFDCRETVKVARKRLVLARGYSEEKVILLEALLRMPHSWSVLHGIAVVKTPIFYIVTSSVPSIERYEVEVEGDFIPREAKAGTTFPFTEVKEQ